MDAVKLSHGATSERNQRLWALVAPRYGTLDLSHDRLHVVRVHHWALELAAAEGLDVDLAGAAGLVHDLVEIPKDHPDRSKASQRSAEAARGPLEAAGYDPMEIEQVAEAVAGSSWSAGQAPVSRLAAVLQDADRLDAIGAVGMARCFVCAQSFNRGQGLLYAPGDPLHRTDRALDDKAHAVDHFFVKLMRLAEGMHTVAGRQEAALRHATMVAFLEALGRELG
ncbi:MAG: hypothetical protein AUK47_03175 [Deltaproteobacteria bacterium CG2_30_63_29]|nr:MAG: hypothetical protein AUK47_03175 [Deltaproteobacteria bacterium CG2_30_63_29]